MKLSTIFQTMVTLQRYKGNHNRVPHKNLKKKVFSIFFNFFFHDLEKKN